MKVLRVQNISNDCIICGEQNPAGVKARFLELEDGQLCALATFRLIHQSYPGRVHGGLITALLDETIGRTINIAEPDTWGVTAELTLRFRKPVPYDMPLRCLGRITKNTRRIFEGEGELLLDDGTIAATATATFFKVPIDTLMPNQAEFAQLGWRQPDNAEAFLHLE